MRIGARIGNYVLEKELARGGFGVVFVGRHAQMGQRVAVKFLHRQWSEDQEQVQRFFNDARAATLADDPGIVKVIDSGFFEGNAYLLMEFLAGEPLSGRLARAPVAPLVAVTLMRQAARALAKVHAVGIIHRDLKPDNLFLVPDPEVPGGERVKLLDFGIAKLADASIANKTATLAVFGTPAYMSPEQCRSAASVDARSDVYSLGCILYEMSCGRPPFEGETGELIGKHLYVAPPAPRSLNPSLSAELEALLRRMLAKDPAARPQSMDDLVRDLDGVARTLGSPPARPARRPGMKPWVAVGVGAIVLAGGVGIWVAITHERGPAPPVARPGLEPGVPAPDAAAAAVRPPGAPPVKVWAFIGSVPRGANGTILGVTQVFTPAGVDALEAGRTYDLVLKKDCYEDAAVQFTPQVDSLNVLTVPLQTLERRVHLTSTPSGAAVSGDGQPFGRTPTDVTIRGDVGPGKPHTFTFKLAGYRDAEVTLAPDAPCTMQDGRASVSIDEALVAAAPATP